MKKIIILSLCFSLLSCMTIDMEKSLNGSNTGSDGYDSYDLIAEITSQITVQPPDIIVLEKPVFVPQAEAPPKPPAAGQNAVRESNRDGILLPQDYSHAAVVYEYNSDLVYEVYTQPLRVSDICLEPGELAVEAPFVSDSERWILGGGVSYENNLTVQHIYVKPASSGLSASLIINTSRRVYRLILRSYADVHMPVVRWRYTAVFPQNYLPSPLSDYAEKNNPSSIDPSLLSFNYRIKHSILKKPYWLPDLVFDDGSKTYIRFPAQVLQREMPAVFENRRFILNYRVLGNLVVIDKLIEDVTVKIERTEIYITKKRG
jgi:type IV secretion system protein VirB9